MLLNHTKQTYLTASGPPKSSAMQNMTGREFKVTNGMRELEV